MAKKGGAAIAAVLTGVIMGAVSIFAWLFGHLLGLFKKRPVQPDIAEFLTVRRIDPPPGQDTTGSWEDRAAAFGGLVDPDSRAALDPNRDMTGLMTPLSPQKPGNVDGRHHTQNIQQVRSLRRAGDEDAAAGLLLRLIEAAEDEFRCSERVTYLAPWYYEQLAIIYRKQKRYSLENSLLARYIKLQTLKGERPPDEIVKRMLRTQELAVMEKRKARK